MEAVTLNPEYKPKITWRVIDSSGNDDDRELTSFSQAIDDLMECIGDEFEREALLCEVELYDHYGEHTTQFREFCRENAEEIAEKFGYRIEGVLK